jgi:hypothetical protein
VVHLSTKALALIVMRERDAYCCNRGAELVVHLSTKALALIVMRERERGGTLKGLFVPKTSQTFS